MIKKSYSLTNYSWLINEFLKIFVSNWAVKIIFELFGTSLWIRYVRTIHLRNDSSIKWISYYDKHWEKEQQSTVKYTPRDSNCLVIFFTDWVSDTNELYYITIPIKPNNEEVDHHYINTLHGKVDSDQI